MKKYFQHFSRITLLTVASSALLSCSYSTTNQGSVNFIIDIEDLDSPGFHGTVFELVDSSKNTPEKRILSIAVVGSRQTFSDSGSSVLQISSDLVDPDFTFQTFPSPTVSSAGVLAVLNTKLLLLQPRQLGEPQIFSEELSQWVETSDDQIQSLYLGSTNINPDCGQVFSVSSTYLRTRYCVFANRKQIYGPGVLSTGDSLISDAALPQFISENFLVLEDYGDIHICFHPTILKEIPSKTNCRTLKLPNSTEFLYAVTEESSGGSVLITTNRGNIFQVTENQKVERPVRVGNLFASQYYTSIFFRGEYLLGEFPSGQIVKWSPASATLEPTDSCFTMSDYERKAKLEPQTFSYFSGSLWIGMWPFGTLFRIDSETKCAIPFKQFLPKDAVNSLVLGETETNPFGDFAAALVTDLATDTDSASLGVRIPSLVIWKDFLIGTTATTYPWIKSEDIVTAAGLRREDLRTAYGQVFGISTRSATTYEFSSEADSWTKQLRISITRSSVNVIDENGKSWSAKFQTPSLKQIDSIQQRIGKGSMGNLAGAKVTVTWDPPRQ